MSENQEETNVEAIAREYENLPEPPEKTPLGEVFDPTPAPVLYDRRAPQQLSFIKEDDDGRYELKFAIDGLPDPVLAEFDKLSFIKVESEGKDQKFLADDLDACEWFFDTGVELVGGFDGELPGDWRGSFDLLEKQAVVKEFLSVDVYSDEAAKFKKKFSFGKPGGSSGSSVKIVTVFNGREMLCAHHLPAGKNKFLRRFIRITQGLISKKGKTGTFLPETFVKLGRLYDEMGISSEDYAPDGIPLHHKALVLRETFSAAADSQRKKLNR